jgi:hypothetical protein
MKQDSTMDRVGIVVSAVGRVTAVTEQGQTRELRVGDALHADDMLVAALDAAATVRLLSGRKLELAPGTVLVLDSDVCDPGDGFDDGSARLCDVQRVLAEADRATRGAVA